MKSQPQQEPQSLHPVRDRASLGSALLTHSRRTRVTSLLTTLALRPRRSSNLIARTVTSPQLFHPRLAQRAATLAKAPYWAPVRSKVSRRLRPRTPSLGKARSIMDHSRGSSLPSGFVQTLGLHSVRGSEKIRTCRDSRQSTWHGSLRSRRACCFGPFSQGNARTDLRRSLSGTAMGQACRRCRQNQVCPRNQAS